MCASLVLILISADKLKIKVLMTFSAPPRFNQNPDGKTRNLIIATQFILNLPKVLVEGSNTEKRFLIISNRLLTPLI